MRYGLVAFALIGLLLGGGPKAAAQTTTTTSTVTTTSTFPWCDPDEVEDILIPSTLRKPQLLQCNWRQLQRENLDILNRACFPGVACSISLPAETYGILSLSRLEDDDVEPNLCLVSGGIGDPMYVPCELSRVRQMCRLFEPILGTDTDQVIGISPGNIRLVGATCHCYGDCTNPASQLRFKDREQNDIDLVGATPLVCGTQLGPDTPRAFDPADADRDMVADEGLHITVDPGPTSDDAVIVCARFTFL